MNKETWKDLLTFSKKEKNGILFLVVMVVIVGTVQWALPFFFQKETIQIDIVHYFGDSSTVDSFDNDYAHRFESTYQKSRYGFEKSGQDKKSEYRWRLLNLPINEVDTTTLSLIRGVGAYSARKILKYRDALGGFIDTSQVRETYNLKSEICDSVLLHTCCFGENIKRININSASDSIMGKHPYIGWKKAKIIRAYLEKHGPFTVCEDLMKMRIWSEEEVSQLCDYLKFSED
ncbi:MAG: helix-hairpin-helix domain-containing protein [Flavobacteriales bacterium]|jgi:competence protein ComEA